MVSIHEEEGVAADSKAEEEGSKIITGAHVGEMASGSSCFLAMHESRACYHSQKYRHTHRVKQSLSIEEHCKHV